MKNDGIEALLHRAAPDPTPLDADRADRVLRNALASVPKPGANRWYSLLGVATLGTATVATVVCFAVWNRTPVAAPHRTAPIFVANHKDMKNAETKKSEQIAMVPAAPDPVLARVASDEIMTAAGVNREPVRRNRSHRHGMRQHSRRANRLRGFKQNAVPVVPDTTPVDNAPYLFVAATGGNAAQSDESLAVRVRTDVPDGVPGRAEAAAVQTLTVASAEEPATPTARVPVWTNVAVETGRESVMTLTALR